MGFEMPEPTNFQINAMTLLDYLYFHDISALQTFSDEKNSFYKKLTESLELIVNKRQYKDLRAQHYKHLLLVGIDLMASYMDEPSKDSQQFTQALNDELCLNIEKAAFNIDEFEQDLTYLLEQYPLRRLSREVLYKIVSQVMSYQFDNIAIYVFTYLVDKNFFEPAKYVIGARKYTQKFIDIGFFRAMLFLEYEAFKNNLLQLLQEKNGFKLNQLFFVEEANSGTLDRPKIKKVRDDFNISSIDLNKKNDLIGYVINIERRLKHKALLTNHRANWISLIGAWYVMHTGQTNPDKTIYRGGVAKFTIQSTWCEIAKQEMLDYGFSISERSLYDAYNATQKFYNLIGIAVDQVNMMKLHGVLEPVLTSFFFYEPMIAPSFKSALEEVNTKLKNKKTKN